MTLRTAKHSKGRLFRTTAALDAATLPQLDQIAPDNISEAIRFCVQFALERGALAAALAQHTPQQRAAYMERYHQPQPVVQLYNGQPIPAPAPQPVETQAAEPAQVSPADMLAYAKSFLPDDEIDAARLELEQMEAAARMQRNN